MSSLNLVADLPSFGSQFWPALVATLIGAFGGFLSALALDRWRDRKSREAQEAALLRAARDAVQLNLTLFGQLGPILAAATQPPSFRMDVGLLDPVVSRLVEISPESELLRELNNFRFQLDHINRKLDYILSVVLIPPPANVPGTIASMQLAASLATLGGSVMLTVQPVQQSAQQTLLPAIDVRLKALAPPPIPWWGFWGG